MLKWFNLLVVGLFVVLSAVFAVDNQQKILVSLPWKLNPSKVRIYALVFISFFSGLLLGGGMVWLNSLRHRREAARLIRQNRELEAEVNNLRNLPLDNDLNL